ncbi:hypothetical protein [Desulfocastanea catecholica]
MIRHKGLWLLVGMVIFPSKVFAQYEATGPFQANSCKGFVIEICGPTNLDAVEKDGKYYEMKKTWDKVDDYRNGECLLRVNESSAVWFYSTKPNFYHYNEKGKLERVKIEGDVTFPCRKT